jgi:hypothetical protein
MRNSSRLARCHDDYAADRGYFRAESFPDSEEARIKIFISSSLCLGSEIETNIP